MKDTKNLRFYLDFAIKCFNSRKIFILFKLLNKNTCFLANPLNKTYLCDDFL